MRNRSDVASWEPSIVPACESVIDVAVAPSGAVNVDPARIRNYENGSSFKAELVFGVLFPERVELESAMKLYFLFGRCCSLSWAFFSRKVRRM